MNLETILAEVQSWPAADRLRLIGEVWDGLRDDGETSELSEALKGELDRRLETLDKNPDAVVAWEVVEARARDRFRK